MSAFQYVLFPISTNMAGKSRRSRTTFGQHWLLIVADMAKQSVSVLNSVPNVEVSEHYLKLFRLVTLTLPVHILKQYLFKKVSYMPTSKSELLRHSFSKVVEHLTEYHSSSSSFCAPG